MIFFIKKIFKSNIFLIVLAEKISTYFNINFEHEYKIVKFIKNPIIFDVGAHKGESIVNFLKQNNDSLIYSFEPNIHTYKIVKKKFYQNNKIKIYNYAISKKKLLFLYIPKIYFFYLTLWASFDKDFLIDRWKKFTSIKINKIKIIKIKIKSITMDSIKILPNLLKIDTEGAELEVIKSGIKLIKRNTPVIILEFNKNNFFNIKNLLTKYNYQIYKFDFSQKTLIKITKTDEEESFKKNNSHNFIFYNPKTKIINGINLK
jgi:FkbM family methyltransferase